jgi:hypothetical protein
MLGWECNCAVCDTGTGSQCTEMEFLDISLTKDSSLLLHAIHWQISKKTILFFGFKNPYKKIRKTKNSCLFMNSILWNRKKRVENQTIVRV